jgi:hypothetical protein
MSACEWETPAGAQKALGFAQVTDKAGYHVLLSKLPKHCDTADLENWMAPLLWEAFPQRYAIQKAERTEVMPGAVRSTKLAHMLEVIHARTLDASIGSLYRSLCSPPKAAGAALRQLGVGGKSTYSFLRMLALRQLQTIGFCSGPLLQVGTRALAMANALCGKGPSEDTVDLDLFERVALALLPIMAWIVTRHLGPAWAALLNMQSVQGGCCEYRKWFLTKDANHESRRPGWEQRAETYDSYLQLFAADWGLPLGQPPPESGVGRPRLELPPGACPEHAQRFLVFFEALVLRFALRVGVGNSERASAGARRLIGNQAFLDCRVNQWTWQLDYGIFRKL